MKQTSLNIAVWLFVCFSCSSCATLFNHDDTEFKLNSDPQGAKVTWNGVKGACKTPCELDLGGKQHHWFKLEKKGYEPSFYNHRNPIHWTGYLNAGFLYFGLVTGAIDYFTGKLFAVKPKQKLIELEPEGEEEDEEEEEEEEQEEIDDAPKEAIPPLPRTKLMERIKQQFDEPYMDDQIKQYYGDLDAHMKIVVRHRIYIILHGMALNEERLSVDEAISKDYLSK